MAVGRAARRAAREARAQEVFGLQATAALDILELLELAWHDCYGEVSPPDQVVADIYTCADGDLAAFASCARLAVQDARDLAMAAEARRRTG